MQLNQMPFKQMKQNVKVAKILKDGMITDSEDAICWPLPMNSFLAA